MTAGLPAASGAEPPHADAKLISRTLLLMPGVELTFTVPVDEMLYLAAPFPASTVEIRAPEDPSVATLLETPDLDAPVLLALSDPSLPPPPPSALADPEQRRGAVAQEILPPPPPAKQSAPPPTTPLNYITQAPTYNNTSYRQFIDEDAIVTTTVNAIQNINTYNVITINQTCGSYCVQTANPSANAVTGAWQRINASANNAASIHQVDLGIAGQSGSTLSPQAASVQSQAATDIQSGIDADSGNAVNVTQTAL